MDRLEIRGPLTGMTEAALAFVRKHTLHGADIGAGDLEQKIEIHSGDELEGLADQFNRMSAQLRESYAGLERKVDEPVLHLVRRSKAAAWRMHQMILNLLDVGQLEEGKLVLRLESLDSGSLARKACQEMEGAAAQRGVRLEVVPGLPVV